MQNETGAWGQHRQPALINARLFLQAAIAEIDRSLGPNYAKEHPELVATFMDICARSCEDATSVELTREQAQEYE